MVRASAGAPDVTVVGCLNVDLVATVPALPRPGETVSGGDLTRHLGGKGANQAAALARLGARVRMVGAVGHDPDGDGILRGLDDAGVDIDGVVRSERPTGTALIAVDDTGENQIAVAPGANRDLHLGAGAFPAGSAVLCQLELGVPMALQALRLARGPFALNASPIAHLPCELVEGSALIVVNAGEYEAMPILQEAPAVIVTSGAEGARLLRRGVEVAHAPAREVDVASTVGAGDAFCAAALVGFLADVPGPDLLAVACAVGAHAVSVPESQPHLRDYAAYA